MRKQLVRWGVWYIGGRRNRRRQRGRFLPIGALAAPILGSLDGVVTNKYLEVKDVDVYDMYRNKILLRKKGPPLRVTLPNGQSFLVRNERVSRKNLPSNFTIRSRTIGPRRWRKRRTHKGAEILGRVFKLGKYLLSSSTLKKGLGIRSRAITFEIGKEVINEGIKHAPGLYNYSTKKKKKKKKWKYKKEFESDIANYAVKQAQKELFNWQNV